MWVGPRTPELPCPPSCSAHICWTHHSACPQCQLPTAPMGPQLPTAPMGPPGCRAEGQATGRPWAGQLALALPAANGAPPVGHHRHGRGTAAEARPSSRRHKAHAGLREFRPSVSFWSRSKQRGGRPFDGGGGRMLKGVVRIHTVWRSDAQCMELVLTSACRIDSAIDCTGLIR
jgi:hypothetical protein